MDIDVVKPGLATSVQDLGRPGYYHLGIPLSGGMDQYAVIAANLLVGNAESDAVLEAVFMGPELRFNGEATVAVTGAELPPKLDGEEVPCWTSFRVKPGQTLSFGYLRTGARAYIAVSDGRALKTGDRVRVGAAKRAAPDGRSVAPALRPALAQPAELRVLTGLYWHRITEAAGKQFFADTWKVAPEADRIGYRFRGGHPLAFKPREQPFGAGSDPSNIVDSCYPYGSIQVPGGTEPIVLHRDAVSGGGYFMIGTVISADMDSIGQLQPNMPTRFVAVDMAAALAARRERNQRIAELRRALA
jgi:allophanate hydrolase subunit 2